MMENSLQEVARLARQGQISHAYDLVQQITAREPDNFQAWVWLAYVAQMDTEKRAALRRARALKPEDAAVRQALLRLVSSEHIRQAARSGVFIGYARADELFAIDLVDSLRSHGITAWLDMTEISMTTTWHSSVTRALTECGVMLLILSPEAIESGELRTEHKWFKETGKLIVPVLHKTCDYDSFDLLCPPVDFRQDYDHGVSALVSLLSAPREAGNSVRT